MKYFIQKSEEQKSHILAIKKEWNEVKNTQD